MGSHDYRHKETKKPKKDAKKASSISSISPVEQPVEVLKTKGKKEPPPEE